MAAGNLGLTYPMTVAAKVNGRTVNRTLPRAGTFEVELPLLAGEKQATIAIESPQSAMIREEELRYKVIRRSMLLETLEFR
jgi:hypothetical protein